MSRVEESSKEGEEVPKKKVDVRAALSMIPPASQLFGEEAKPRERRVRLRFRDDVKKSIAVVNPSLAAAIGAEDEVEIVVAHRKRFRYKLVKDEGVPETEVWVNGEGLPEQGVSDNSIVTIRPARRT